MNGLFADCDALVTPFTDTTAPATLETTGTPKFQAPWSCAGVPAVSIPCGLAPDGMPVGLQLVGRQNQDEALLGVAQWCESAINFKKTPALLKGLVELFMRIVRKTSSYLTPHTS